MAGASACGRHFATALTSLVWRRSELAVSAFVSLARDNHLSSAA
jgi:hypothetical protein